MVFRRPRTHHVGRSNADIRSAFETKPIRKARLPIHESSYAYHQDKLKVSRVPEIPPPVENPLKSQSSFYLTQGKMMKSQGSFPQTARTQLSGKNAFVGGDNEPYIKRPGTTLSRHSSFVDQDGKVPFKKGKYYKTKEIEHKKAEQETQLVHMSHKESLASQIDLKKVADIRRAIRRRYANRSDFRKIFNQWDENSIGVLRADDVHRMVNRLGIPVNELEARVLVASANISKTGSLNLSEFMQLIFDDSDKMNVDLAALDELPDDNHRNFGLISNFEMAVNQRTRKIQNELKINIKDNISLINPQLIRKDKNKNGRVHYEDFANILNDMGWDQTISNEKSWKMLFEEMGGDYSGLEYRKFLSAIDNFSSAGVERLERSFETVNPVIKENQKMFDQLIEAPKLQDLTVHVQDRQKVPVNQLDSIYKRARKIRQFVRESVRIPQVLKRELHEISRAEVISLEDLKNYILKKCEKQNFQITKRELEGFLSGYIYNQDSITPIKDIVHNVFLDDTKAAEELAIKRRAIPPVREKDLHQDGDAYHIMHQLDTKMFVQGVQNIYKVFKMLDIDGDGYLTKTDLQVAFDAKQITYDEKQMDAFIKHVDKNNNGFVTFKEFADTIRGDKMLEQEYRQTFTPSFISPAQPNSSYFQKRMESTGDLKKYQELLLQSDAYSHNQRELIPNTRFTARPQHRNTFALFQADPNSGMYLDIDGQFNGKNRQPINIGLEDKQRYQRTASNKIQYLKSTREEVSQRAQGYEQRAEILHRNKIMAKAAIFVDYENRCHMNVPFANESIA